MLWRCGGALTATKGQILLDRSVCRIAAYRHISRTLVTDCLTSTSAPENPQKFAGTIAIPLNGRLVLLWQSTQQTHSYSALYEVNGYLPVQ